MDLDTYFKSAFTVDNVIFGFDEGDLKVLLIKRGEEPFKDTWALPGYFVNPGEDLEMAAKRILKELTGLENVYLEQVRTFGAVDRHPYGRVITVAYYSLVKISAYKVNPSSIAEMAQWHSVDGVGKLPFDHNAILEACLERLKTKVRHKPIGFELLPPKFTLTELQHLYESILLSEKEKREGKRMDKRNFRKKMLSIGLLIDLKETQEGVAHRPAKLYRFDRNKYNKLSDEGTNFEFISVRQQNPTNGVSG